MGNINLNYQEFKTQPNGYNSLKSSPNQFSPTFTKPSISSADEKLSKLFNGIYRLTEDASALNLIDQINRCLEQAHSLAVVMMDESFGEYSIGVISAYGEAISDRVEEGKILANKLYEKYCALEPTQK